MAFSRYANVENMPLDHVVEALYFGDPVVCDHNTLVAAKERLGTHPSMPANQSEGHGSEGTQDRHGGRTRSTAEGDPAGQ